MDNSDRPTSELCKAFKQALHSVVAETLLSFDQIDEATGISTSNLRNGRTRPTDEDVAAIDAVFPGFKIVYEEYLLGITRLVSLRNQALSAQVGAQNADFNARVEFWQKKYLEENEAHMKLLYELRKKEEK